MIHSFQGKDSASFVCSGMMRGQSIVVQDFFRCRILGKSFWHTPGGLDTSVIVRWLQETYQCEVVTFTADLGQGEEVEPARAKAEALV